MSAIRPWVPTASFDEFLDDPAIRSELEAVLSAENGRFYSPDAVLKVRRRHTDKREKLSAEDAAAWIINRWRELRP